MLSIAICDDNEEDLMLAKCRIEQYFHTRAFMFKVYEYVDGEQLIDDLSGEDQKAFDIIFLDMFMPVMTGLETAKRIRELSNRNEKIVFITTSDEYALECYNVFAYSYIVKPYTNDKLFSILDRLVTDEFETKKASIMIKYGGRHERIPLSSIVYIESKLRELIVHLTDGTRRNFYGMLDDVERGIAKPYFLRSHKSYLVNMNHITSVQDAFTTMTGQNVPIRKNGAKQIKDEYFKYVLKSSIDSLE